MSEPSSVVVDYISKHGENSLIAAISSSDYNMFEQLLAAHQPVDSYHYGMNRGVSLPLLPIHVAAAHDNSEFLKTLIAQGADPDDSCQYNTPEFDNTFRSAARAGKWKNLSIIIQAGGVEGAVDCDYLWAARHRSLIPDEGDTPDETMALIHSLFCMTWDELQKYTLPEAELERRRTETYRFDSFGPLYEDESMVQELNNLDWIITVYLPHLDDSRRLQIVDELLRGGFDITCYTSPSPIDMWNIRAKLLTSQVKDHTRYYVSPIQSLGSTYHAVHTPLHACVFMRNDSLLRYFVSQANMNVDIPEFNTRAATPLQLAIEYGQLDMCKTLLELGAHIDLVTPIMRLTSLHFAASTYDLNLLQWVVDRIREALPEDKAAAIFKQRSLLGHTALHIACMPRGHVPAGQQLSIHYVRSILSGNSTPLSPNFVRLLISVGGGSWSDQDNQGNTPAHYLAATDEGDDILGTATSEVGDVENVFGEKIDQVRVVASR